MADYSITGDTKLDTSGFTKGVSSMTVAAGNLISDLTKTAATKLAGLAKSSVSVGMNFDASMSQVAATMGTTVDQIDNLTKVAKEMGSTTKFTATQAADALNYLALAGYDANKAAEVLPSVLNLAAAGGMDLAYASDLVTDAMASLNIEANKQNVDDFGNKLAMAASKANANVSQLGEAILTVGGTAANLKGGTTELTTALGLLANVGIKGAEGGTHLRNIILSLQSPTDEAAKKMQKLGLQVYDSQGKMRGLNDILSDLNSAMNGMTQGQKDSIINQLFNKTDLAAVNGLLAAQGDQWNTLAAQIDNADGAMGQMAETQIDNLQGAMTIMSSAFEGMQLAVYDELEPTLTEAVKWGTDCLTQLTTALSEGGPEAMLAAAGEIISDLAAGIAEQLPGLMTTGVEIITQLAQNLTDTMPAMLDTGAEVLAALAQGIINATPALLTSATEIIAEFMLYLGDHADEIMDTGMQLLESLVIGITDNLPQLITAAAALIAKWAAALIAHLPDILKCGAAMLTTLVDGIVCSLENLAEAALACVAKLVGVWDGSMDEWGHIGENIVSGLLNGIKGAWNSLTKWVSNGINGLVSGVKGRLGIHSPSKVFDEIGVQVCNGLAQGLNRGNKKVKDAAKTVVASVTDSATTLTNGVAKTVETVTERMANGATQQKQTITETSRQMVGGVLKDIKTVTSIAADGTKTVKQTMETVRETAKTVTSTFETLADGVKTTTQTVTETLTDGTETQKQVITEVYDDVVDGALVTIERVKTIAADGTVQVAETTKKSAADTFDGLWKELQTEADTGVLGTFDDLYTAVKNQDWLSIGKWVASTIYGGLTADQKKQVNDFALGIVTKLNKALGGARDQLVQGAIDLGGQIVNGLTGGFSEVWQQAQGLGSTLIEIFGGLKTPLSNAALAISQGMKGGLISAFPEILASLGSLIGSIGGAFVAMLDAIAAALFPTGFGTPQALLMIAAGVALAAVIAGIVASIGGSFSKKGSSGRGSSSGGSSGSGGMGSVDITTGTGSLEDAINANTKALEKTNSALADMIRQAGALVLSDNMRLGSTVAASGTAQVVSAARSYHREGDTTINQYIQSKAQTAADLARETRWEADKAKARKR
ncbi:phage tail tape measure protein [Faecalibacterium sp. i20-0019-C2]|uniref:phage tail tape measure protein n=1 Tax=unclassified Faecalibacterium TaxID=2646395 RepID=UPI0034A93BFA